MKTYPIIEQHFHGAYGVDFNKADEDEVVYLCNKLREIGIAGFFPTLVTDSIEHIKRQVSIIRNASKKCSGILGIHLEGIFINPDKKGIHNSEYFLDLTKDNFQKVEDEFIKIVTLAPELDKDLIQYLKSKNIKVQAGHCTGYGNVDGVTHIFNAMSGIHHRKPSTVLSALNDDNAYTEVIADGVHVSDEALRLLFKIKPSDKIILISDSLPITYSSEKKAVFADSEIYYDGNVAASKDGTIAGSTKLLPQIIKILGQKKLFNPKYIENVYTYHNIKPQGFIEWDEDYNITEICYN